MLVMVQILVKTSLWKLVERRLKWSGSLIRERVLLIMMMNFLDSFLTKSCHLAEKDNGTKVGR